MRSTTEGVLFRLPIIIPQHRHPSFNPIEPLVQPLDLGERALHLPGQLIPPMLAESQRLLQFPEPLLPTVVICTNRL